MDSYLWGVASEAIAEIRDLGSTEALLAMLDEAHAPREHPSYPGEKVERQHPTVWIEGYTACLLRVNSIIAAAETRAKQEATSWTEAQVVQNFIDQTEIRGLPLDPVALAARQSLRLDLQDHRDKS